MKKKLFVIFELIVIFILSTCVVTFAWLSAAKNTINTFVTGSLVSDYFHCGSGTADDPFVITRPIHYYHMTEFFQRDSEIPVVYRYSSSGDKEFVTFGTDKLYFQIGCPEQQLRNKDLRPALNGETGSGYFAVDENTQYYVFSYTNSGEVIKEGTGEGDETQDAMSQNLNMAYYSSSNALMPLGSSDKPFYGVFDGSGLTISNLNIISASTFNGLVRSTSDVGIFGVLKCETSDGTKFVDSSIKNCYFDQVTISSVGATATTTCSVTGSTHSDIYMGYLVGHVYSYSNASGRDYQLNTVSTPSDPVSDVYINNATISGGTTDSSICNFGYFGHVDLLDGENAVAIASQVDEMEQSGTGDEGWGGSIDMTSLYNRLKVTIGSSSSTRSTTVPTAETIVAPSSTSGTSKTTIDSTQSSGQNDNRSTVYYWSAADLKNVSTNAQANTTGGTIIGTQSSSWIYLYGMKDLGLTTTTTYSKSGDSIPAYYISDNNTYIAVENAAITQADISKNAAKFVFSNISGTGTIQNYGENIIYYLKANSTYSGLELTTEVGSATHWTHTQVNGKNYISCKNSSNQDVYLVYDNSWQLVSGVNYYVISDGNDHYLSANTSGILNISNADDSVSWKQTTSGDNGYKFYFEQGTTPYYLAVSNGKLAVSTSDCVWTRASGSGTGKYVYYTTQGTSNFYLIYDNGWRAKELEGFVIYNGTHYLYADKNQVSSSSEENATLFHRVSSGENVYTLYTVLDGVNYYLDYQNGVLYTTTNSSSWTKDSKGLYKTIGGVNYYLVYQDGWKVTPISGIKFYSDSQYLSYQLKTVSGVSTYVVTSTTESNACFWQISGNKIYSIDGNVNRYLCVDDDGNLVISSIDGDLWYEGQTTGGTSMGYYTIKNGSDRFYLVYDKGFKVTIRSGYKISDGNGHFLSRSGNGIVATDESNATIWQLSNTAIATSQGNSYIYTLDGTTRVYLYEVSGDLAVHKYVDNFIDYSLSSRTMSNGANNMTIEYSKENKTFTLVNGATYNDCYATLDQTVDLVAGTTYYMHLELSDYSGSGVQIFYAFNSGDYWYNEADSHRFNNAEDTDYVFTAPRTGTYHIRMDNDLNGLQVVSHFYIGEEPYFNNDSIVEWNNNATGLNITTEDDDNLYLNYNSSASRWELITTGGFYVYSSVGSSSYYLSTTGTSLTTVTSEASASAWQFENNILYTYIGTTKYYITYETRTREQYNADTLTRRLTDVVLTLTTTKASATNWLTDSDGNLYFNISYSNLGDTSTVPYEQKFYLFYDSNDATWKVKADLNNGYIIRDSSSTKFMSVEFDGSNNPILYTELDSNYATVWYRKNTHKKNNSLYTFIGITAVVVNMNFSSGTDVFTPALSTGNPGHGWNFNDNSITSSTYGMSLDLLYNTAQDTWDLTHYTKYSISYNGNYLSINGTSIQNSTSSSNAQKWILINGSKNDGLITQGDSGKRIISTMMGNNIYVLTSNLNGDLSLTKDSNNYNKTSGYFWYLDDIGYYQIVNGIKMYLIFDGTTWKTTVAHILVSEYNTENYISLEKDHLLPTEYQQLEYIESNGTQYINTGVPVSDNNTIEIKVNYSQVTTLYGCSSSGWATNTAVVYTENSYIRFLKTNKMYNLSGTGTFVINHNPTNLIVNGTSYSYVSDSGNTSTGNITLFKGYHGKNELYGSYRMYYAKIYQGDVLVRDYIPCYEESTNKEGLYDLINNQFYPNNNSSSFIRGEEISVSENGSMRIEGYSLPSDYEQVDCITATGSQYINTGVIPNNNYSIEAYYSFSSLSSTASLWCSRTAFNASDTYTTLVNIGDAMIRVDYGGYESISILKSNLTLQINTIYKFAQSGTNLLLDNIIIGTSSISTVTGVNPLYLMASHSGSGSSIGGLANYLKGNCYGCKIYNDSNVLVRNFVPCYKKSTSKFGLYDTVTNTFYMSNSSTDFSGSTTYVIGDSGSDDATEWNFKNGNIYAEINGETKYLNANINGKVTVSSTPSTWTSVSTANGTSFQTNLTIGDGKKVTYYLAKENGGWCCKPLNYTTISQGSNYLAVGDTGILHNTSIESDDTKIYYSEADSSGNVCLFALRNNTVYYLSHALENCRLYIMQSPDNSYWSKEGNLYYTTIEGTKVYIVLNDVVWDLYTQYRITGFKSNGVTLGFKDSGFFSGMGRLLIDDSNRVFEVANSKKWYINFNDSTSSALTVSNSTTNAMVYDSTNKVIRLSSHILYYDLLNSNWNVYKEGSFSIASGSNYLAINGTSSFTNTTDSTKASYFVLSDSTNHKGTLTSYYNGQKIFLTYNSGDLVVSTSGVTWENIGSANSAAGTLDVLGYCINSSYYCITYSSGWKLTRPTEYKIGNTLDGSGTGFFSHNGTNTGWCDDDDIITFTNKASASIWTFTFTTSSPYRIDYMSHKSSRTYYCGWRTYYNNRYVYITTDTDYQDDWVYENNSLATIVSSTNYYLYYGDTTHYLDNTNRTTIYLFPNVSSLTLGNISVTKDGTKTNMTTNGGTLTSTNGTNSVTELTLEYSGDYNGIVLTNVNSSGLATKADRNTYTRYYSTTEDLPNNIVPNATIILFESPSNVNKKNVTLDSTGTNVKTKNNTATNINVTEISDIPAISMIATTDKPFSPLTESYQRGCYIALRVAKDGSGNIYSDYRADNKNTGYIVGGDYSSASGSGQGDIRVSGYDVGNISGSYSSRNDKFTTLYTFNDSGLQAINDSSNTYNEYSRTKADFLQTVIYGDNNGGGDVYGLHFMNTQISLEHKIKAESVLINGKTYVNYELPESCIDFNVYQKGTIVLYAGDYYSGNKCFFSLNQIFRNNSNEIISIKEIEYIYKKNNATAKEAYVYKYKDGTYSKTISSSELASNYTCVFKTVWLTNPNNNTSFSNDYIYYFEIPCNKGEYALGSVSGRDGGYLLYLDIASNGNQGATYNQDAGISDDPVFTQIDFRSSSKIINSPLNFAYTIPTGSTIDNFQITMQFDGEYIYTLTINNSTGQEMDFSVLLVDNDDDPDNVFPFEYKIIYNGSIYTAGLGYNESTQTYSTTATYKLPAGS